MKHLMSPFLMVAITLSVGAIACSDVENPPTDQASQALASSEFDYEYFSDATYTTSVGERFNTCGIPGIVSSGTTSRFIIGSQTSCKTGTNRACYRLAVDGSLQCGSGDCVNCQP